MKCVWCGKYEEEPSDEFHHCSECCDVAKARKDKRNRELGNTISATSRKDTRNYAGTPQKEGNTPKEK